MHARTKTIDKPVDPSTFSKIRLKVLDAAESSQRFAMAAGAVSCRPGCDGCCKRLVRISILEAVVLLQSMDEEHKKRVLEKSKEMADISIRANSISWFKMNIPCPLLSNDKKCSVYSSRPVVCSTHFVSSTPEACDPWYAKNGEYRLLNDVKTFQKFRQELSVMSEFQNLAKLVWPIPNALIAANIILETKFEEWENISKIMERR